MILNNVHDLSFYFPLHRRESIGTFLSVDCTHFVSSSVCDPLNTIPTSMQSYTYNEYTSQKPTTEDRNVGMECRPYICSSVLFIFDRNEIILMNGWFFQLLSTVQNTAIHLLSTNYCWPIQIDIYLCNVNSHYLFFFYLVLVLFINENNFIDRITFFIMFFVFVLLSYF